MQSYNKFFKFASVRVFFRKKIEFILLFYARRWLWMLAYGRHLGACFFLLAFFFFLLAFSFSSCSRSFFRPFISRFVLLAFFLSSFYLAFFFVLLAFFLSSFYLAFLPARVLSFVLLSRVLFLPARVLSFVLLSRVLSFLSSCSRSFSSCSRSFFRPFISRSFFSFFLLAFSFSSCSRSFFRPFISCSFFSFFLLAFFLSSCSNSFFLTNPPPKFAYIKNLLYLCTQI